jgi:LemA protein
LLRQRHDELPKLIAVCARYMEHERTLIERVATARGALAAARERQDVRALGPLESGLATDVARLTALAEGYPRLKADASFLQVQRRIADLETAIADRREFFNATVTINNTQIRQFPNLLFARAFGMRELSRFSPGATTSARDSG